MHSIRTLKEQFEHYLKTTPVGSKPVSLYEPADYIMQLGGKRMRPLLLLAAYQIFDQQVERALPAALAIEVFHNFTLVHDDIMDQAATRRNQPAVHVKYDLNTAILSGDVMMIRSFELLLDAAPRDQVGEILTLFTRTAREICEGQQQDMNFESIQEVSVEQYLAMNQLKTGVLLATSLEIGAALASAERDIQFSLYEAGLALGSAFQVQDDILDLYGDEVQFGKKRGGDILNAKKTYLYAYTISKLASGQREQFMADYHMRVENPEVKIQRIMRWFDTVDARRYASDYVDTHYDKGTGMLYELAASQPTTSVLIELVEALRSRLT